MLTRFSGSILTLAVLGILCAALDVVRADTSLEGERIGLTKTIALAIKQSPDLANAKIDIEIAEAGVTESTGAQNWVVTAGLNYQRRRDSAVAGNVTGTNRLDRYSYRGGLSKLLPTGGVLDITTTGERQDAVFALVGSESVQYQSQVTIGVTQPLLAGRGKQVAYAAETLASLEKKAAALTSRVSAREALRVVIQAYWDLSLAIREWEIGKSALALAKEQLRVTRAGVKLGRIAATEATAVQQIIATREEEAIVARLRVSRRSLALRRLIGLPIGEGAVDLKTKATLNVKARPLKIDALLQNALATSPELARLATRSKGSTIELEVNENGTLPRLDLTVRGGPLGTGSNPDTSFENLSRFRGYTFVAGLSLEHAIGQSGSAGGAARAQATLRRVKVTEQDVKNQISVAVVESALAAKAGEERMNLAKRAIKLAEENIVAEQKRFELGRATNFDVLSRQDELRQAQLRLARGAVDTLNARARLDSLTDEIFDRYGVNWSAGQ